MLKRRTLLAHYHLKQFSNIFIVVEDVQVVIGYCFEDSIATADRSFMLKLL